jgi:hypothetical protein
MPPLDRETLGRVQLQLEGVKIEIQDLESRMILLQQSLTPYLPPPTPEDEDLSEEVDEETTAGLDPAAQIHASLGCWLRDRLSPLLTEICSLLEQPPPLGTEPEER